MRYAVMSDVHANPRALDTALADARRMRCDRFVMLGDTTGYGYDAPGALETVRRSFDIVLMGNHDSACAGLEPPSDVMLNRNYDLDVAQRAALSPDDMKWLRSRPLVAREGDCAFVHGEFSDPSAWKYVFDSAGARESFGRERAAAMFCGHTHHAGVWQSSAGEVIKERLSKALACVPSEAQTLAFRIPEGCRVLVNAGSVGYPRNDFCISYAIYDTASRGVSIRRLPFDFKSYISDMNSAGVVLPFWLVRMLLAVLGREGNGTGR